jgi:hypothetical protein
MPSSATHGPSTIEQYGVSPKAAPSAQNEDYARQTPAHVMPVGRQSTVLVRRRLPWLDGLEQRNTVHIPGQYDSKDSLTEVNASNAHPQATTIAQPTALRKPTATILDRDPALRAVGSEPSLRQPTKLNDFTTLSLSSKLRPGIIPPVSKEHARQSLGIVDETGQHQDLPSSEYSTTPSSEDMSSVPKTSANYQHLVDRQVAAKLGDEDLLYSNPEWTQSAVDLPLNAHLQNNQTIPHGTIEHPYHEVAQSPRIGQRTDSCRSCGQVAPLKDLPRARTVPRRSIAVPPPEPACSQPQMRPARKPTLFAMPEHLLPSSSSSSWDQPPQFLARQTENPPPTATRRPTASASPRETRNGQAQSLGRAVTGLENLMEEALHVARDAAQTGRNDEVANILNSATLTLRKASTVRGQMDQGHMSRPLRLSPPESRQRTDSDSIAPDSDVSSIRSQGGSVETAPTQYSVSSPPSQQPVRKEGYNFDTSSPQSHKASFDHVNRRKRAASADRSSLTNTPPRLYQPPSADSIVRDFAYARQKTARAEAARALSRSHGAAEDYYGDTGQSVVTQPGVRPSISRPMFLDKPLPPIPRPSKPPPSVPAVTNLDPPHGRRQRHPVQKVEPVSTNAIPPRSSSWNHDNTLGTDNAHRRRDARHHRPQQLSRPLQSGGYGDQTTANGRSVPHSPTELKRGDSLVTDSRYEAPNDLANKGSESKEDMRYSGPPTLLHRDISLRHPRRKHISLRENQGFSLGRYHRRQPIAREWHTHRKRISAMIACLNTVFVGLIAGIYVGSFSSTSKTRLNGTAGR